MASKTDETKVNFKVNDAVVPITIKTLKLFGVYSAMIDDLGISPEELTANLPAAPIQPDIPFSNDELETFIHLLEYLQDTLKTEHMFFTECDALTISNLQLKKYLILANSLDCEKYLNALCKYTAMRVLNGDFKM